MGEDEGFLRTIVESQADPVPRLVYADWLEERADPRGPYVRAELEWAQLREPANEQVLRELATGIDPVWAARVSRPPVGVCCDHVRFFDPGQPRPRLTPADLDWVQNRFNLTLPPDYRAFLLNYNAAIRNRATSAYRAGTTIPAITSWWSISLPSGRLPNRRSTGTWIWCGG